MHGCQIPGDLIAEQIFSDKSGASMVCRQRLPKAVKGCSVLTAHGCSRLLHGVALGHMTGWGICSEMRARLIKPQSGVAKGQK